MLLAPCTTAGSLTFVSDEQESTSDEVQVAIVLGLAFCPNSSCEGIDPSSTGVGTILYNGPFNPQDLPSMPALGLHQNFTVGISPFANAGPMLLTLTHLELTGVSGNFSGFCSNHRADVVNVLYRRRRSRCSSRVPLPSTLLVRSSEPRSRSGEV